MEETNNNSTCDKIEPTELSSMLDIVKTLYSAATNPCLSLPLAQIVADSNICLSSLLVMDAKNIKSKKKEKLIILEEPPIKNIELLNENFKKCLRGFHMINSSPVNETIWEDLNSLIFVSSGIEVYSKSDGSHLSGMDIKCSLGSISNKSAKYSTNKKHIDISSYRLTTVCSENNCGNPETIIEEINRRKNFDYYSFIIRDETGDGVIDYDWLFIPSDHLSLDPASYVWGPLIGKRGKNKDAQIGWCTNEINGCKMSITFSMSSQLWIHIEMTEEIKKFIIANAKVFNKQTLNYIQLSDTII